MTRSIDARGFVVLAIIALVGCGPAPESLMTAVPPPAGWAERVMADREGKDEIFRTDPETPLLAEDRDGFEGLLYWDLNPDYRFVGPVRLYENPERFSIATTSGKERPCERYGWVSFEIDGERHSLQVYRLLDGPPSEGPPQLFVPFIDATTGKETYPAGRYLDLVGEAGGLYVLDFNQAYNPLCAYGAPERYFCPVTPRENRLSVRIEAGERGYKRHTGETR